jgi:hypothetical protein
MPRRAKKARIQVLRASEANLAPQAAGENLKAMIERLVRERVDEIVSQPGAMLTDFQPKEVTSEIRRRQNMFERRKWALYFERWGCRRCGTKEQYHAANGHCRRCQNLLVQRIARIKRDYEREHPTSKSSSRSKT